MNKLIWHFIVGAPRDIWALYKDEKNEFYKFDSFDSSLMGFIERTEDGSWDCFAINFIGNEPNKQYAMEVVYNNSLDQTARSKRQ